MTGVVARDGVKHCYRQQRKRKEREGESGYLSAAARATRMKVGIIQVAPSTVSPLLSSFFPHTLIN